MENHSIRLLSWNLNLYPSLLAFYQDFSALKVVLPKITEMKPDIICFQGVFWSKARRKIARYFEKGFPYSLTEVGETSILSRDSGLMVFSRFPIKKHLFRQFPGSFSENFIQRGLLIATVELPESCYFHLATTCMSTAVSNLWEESLMKDTRLQQLGLCSQWLKEWVGNFRSGYNLTVLAGFLDLEPFSREYAEMITDIFPKCHDLFDPLGGKYTEEIHGLKKGNYVLQLDRDKPNTAPLSPRTSAVRLDSHLEHLALVASFHPSARIAAKPAIRNPSPKHIEAQEPKPNLAPPETKTISLPSPTMEKQEPLPKETIIPAIETKELEAPIWTPKIDL